MVVKEEQSKAAAQAEYNTMKDRFDNLSTANVYSNLNNPVMKNLTVNQQQANFTAQQQTNQGLANTMRSLQGAAGGSWYSLL